jgi:hypothetical protein
VPAVRGNWPAGTLFKLRLAHADKSIVRSFMKLEVRLPAAASIRRLRLST